MLNESPPLTTANDRGYSKCMDNHSYLSLGRVATTTDLDRLRALSTYSHQSNAGHYGSLAWGVTKAAGLALIGLGGIALGNHGGGASMLHHAAAEVIQITEDL